MSSRTYHQSCSLALALDQIGERWTWLILRGLLTGPKRFGELQDQLPGIGTNLLASRLKLLCEQNIARKSGKGRQSAYELTDIGEQLRPITHELIRWGRHFWPDSQQEPVDTKLSSRPEWDMLAIEAAFNEDRGSDVNATLQFTLSGFTFHLVIKNGKCRAVTGPSVSPDVSITSDSATLMAISRQETSISREEEKVRLKIEGDRSAFNLLFEVFD